MSARALLGVAALLLAGCDGAGADDQIGPNPRLPAPRQPLLPAINVPKVIGWREGEAPRAPPGFAVQALARGLAHPRFLYVLPGGDILVVETRAPSPGEPVDRPKEPIRDWLQGLASGSGDARGEPGNRITLLRDADGNGVPEARTVFLEGLESPFGVVLVGDSLYVANTSGIVRYPYAPGATHIAAPPQPLTPLPGGPYNHHWTKSLTASPDGARLYATVGSNSNVGENGMEAEHGRAAVWEIDRASGAARLFATGLRNPNSPRFYPGSGELWVVVNERDEIGANLVSDYLTSVRPGAFYGWPYSYYGGHVDARVRPQRPDLVKRAIAPDYALGSHVAALGLDFYTAQSFPPPYRGGAFIGEHGSWNRNRPAGYKVAFVPFAAGGPSGRAQDFLTGFLAGNGETHGRPVGIAVDRTGALLVADDVGNTVWRVRWVGQGAR